MLGGLTFTLAGLDAELIAHDCQRGCVSHHAVHSKQDATVVHHISWREGPVYVMCRVYTSAQISVRELMQNSDR